MTRPDMSSGGRPLYVHTTATTGMPMLGKMSVGVLIAADTPKMTISIAITTNVYGLLRAIRTIASIELFDGSRILWFATLR